jgi:hypothetical protein
MPKDPIVESHIAQSKAKIENAAPETVETERHIDRTQHALERSRELLKSFRDPLQFGESCEHGAIVAVENSPGEAAKKPASRKTKPKRPR